MLPSRAEQDEKRLAAVKRRLERTGYETDGVTLAATGAEILRAAVRRQPEDALIGSGSLLPVAASRV